jgi:hypothetical protein
LKLQEKYTIEKGGISMQNDWQGEQILPENAGFLTIIVCFLLFYQTKEKGVCLSTDALSGQY